MGPVNEPIFDRNENNFIREGWGGKRWEEVGRKGKERDGERRGGGGKGKERDWERRGGEEKGRRGIGREEVGRKGKERDGERRGRKDSVPVQNKQKTKQNKSNNPQAHGMSA